MSINNGFITTVFFNTQYSSKIELWNDKDIWGVIRTYPTELREKFESIRQGLKQYIQMGEISDLSSNVELDYHFLKKFYYYLSKTECLEKSFAKARGLYLSFGLNWCKYKIQDYYQKHFFQPKYDIYPYDSMKYFIFKGIFSQYGIKTWQDLISESLIGQKNYSPDRSFIRGQAGLERVRKYLHSIFGKENRLPKVSDPGVHLISKAAHRGMWSKYNINSWPDLLWSLFGEKYLPFQSQQMLYSVIRHPKTQNKEVELQDAKKQLLTHRIETNQYPTRKQYPQIVRKCNGKYWIDYGISSWSVLFEKIFGPKENALELLNQRREQMREFFQIHGRIPKWNDKGIGSIITLISRGKWHQWGIYCWKDLKMDVFGHCK